MPSLDGWRAIAIAMVVASHALTIASAHGGGVLNSLAFRLGTFGVMLFFAISGYLICTRLLIEEETTGSISLRSFYIRRVFRILPPAYVYLAVVAALSAVGVISVAWPDITSAALFYSNYIESHSWFTGHFWSLAMEEHFYLLWPPLLLLLGRKRAAWAGGGIIVLTLVLRELTVRQLAPGSDLPGYTHLRWDAFMFPCILAILLRDTKIATSFTALMTPRVWCLVIGGLAAGIVARMVFPGWREPQRVLQAAALPVIIVATVLRPNDWMGIQLNRPSAGFIGRTSYSIYLWQQIVFGYHAARWETRILLLPFQLSTIVVLAALSRRFIEKPMIAAGKQMASHASRSQ